MTATDAPAPIATATAVGAERNGVLEFRMTITPVELPAPTEAPSHEALRDAAIDHLGTRHGRAIGEMALAKMAEHADPLPAPLADALRLEMIAAAVNDIAAAEARHVGWGVHPEHAALFRSAATSALASQIRLSVVTAVAVGTAH